MEKPIVTEELRRKILIGAAIFGIFFGLMPPYVFTIVVVATWGVPPMEPPEDQTFRTIYLVRLVLGNVVGLSVGGFLAAGAVALGLRVARKATYLRGLFGGLALGAPVGAITAGSCPLFLLLSSTNAEWAWLMIQRSFLCGAFMGMTNGMAAGLVVVYFIKQAGRVTPL